MSDDHTRLSGTGEQLTTMLAERAGERVIVDFVHLPFGGATERLAQGAPVERT